MSQFKENLCQAPLVCIDGNVPVSTIQYVCQLAREHQIAGKENLPSPGPVAPNLVPRHSAHPESSPLLLAGDTRLLSDMLCHSALLSVLCYSFSNGWNISAFFDLSLILQLNRIPCGAGAIAYGHCQKARESCFLCL